MKTSKENHAYEKRSGAPLETRTKKRERHDQQIIRTMLGGSPHDKNESTYMIRRRRRRSGCSLLGDNHPSLLRRRVRSSAPRGGHRLRRRSNLRLPHHLPSAIAEGSIGGVATIENIRQVQASTIEREQKATAYTYESILLKLNTGKALLPFFSSFFSSFSRFTGGCGAIARTGMARIGQEEPPSPPL